MQLNCGMATSYVVTFFKYIQLKVGTRASEFCNFPNFVILETLLLKYLVLFFFFYFDFFPKSIRFIFCVAQQHCAEMYYRYIFKKTAAMQLCLTDLSSSRSFAIRQISGMYADFMLWLEKI